jgi:hypothetical protein
VEPYGLQEDDERDEERENTGKKSKNKNNILMIENNILITYGSI